MRSNNWQQEPAPRHDPLSVMLLGFGAMLEEKLEAFFKLERQSDRVYTLGHPDTDRQADILLVNYDNPSAVQQKESILSNNPDAQVVAVSRGPLNNPPSYHIRGILTVSRLLTVFDSIQFSVTAAALTSVSRTSQAIRTHHLKTAQEQAASDTVPLSAGHYKTIITAKANGYRALIVDDSLAIQKSIEIKLAALEQIAAIDCADSGEDALKKAEINQYDLIFLDIMMPGIDGYETCTRLRKKPEYKKTPIIMVSGKTSPLDEVKGVMAGCTTYLTKPVKDDAFNKLSLRILAWLTERKPAAGHILPARPDKV